MPDPADKLSAKQHKAIAALLREPTLGKVAQAAGVNEKTLYRWMREPAFSKAYREARREFFRHTMSLTQRYSPHMVQVLMKVANDPNSADSAKVSAATAMLKLGRESIELDDVVERVEALEQATQKPGGGRGRAA